MNGVDVIMRECFINSNSLFWIAYYQLINQIKCVNIVNYVGITFLNTLICLKHTSSYTSMEYDSVFPYIAVLNATVPLYQPCFIRFSFD